MKSRFAEVGDRDGPDRLAPLVGEGIDVARIVFVAGARQVGKTTLIRHITRAES